MSAFDADDTPMALADLHSALLRGDPGAAAAAAEYLLPAITVALRDRFPRVGDPTLAHDAAVDAVMWYLGAPARYDPARGTLLPWLLVYARSRLLDALRREGRRADHERPTRIDDAWLQTQLDAEGRGDELPVQWVPDTEASDPVLLRAVMNAFPNPADREVLHLLQRGERRTSAYAAVLALGHLGHAERARAVERHKDRVRRKLARLRARLVDDLTA